MKEFKNSFTDSLILLVFVISLSALVYIVFFGFINGTLLRIANPVDSYGQVCGASSQPLIHNYYSMKNNKFLFYFGVTMDSKSICVKSCPNYILHNYLEYKEYILQTQNYLCETYFIENIKNQNFYNKEFLFNDQGPCPSFPILSNIPIQYHCIPYVKNMPYLTDKFIKSSLDAQFFKKNLGDRLLGYLKAFSKEIYINIYKIMLMPLIFYVLYLVIINLIIFTKWHNCFMWFNILFGIMTTYVLAAYLVWLTLCQHTYLIKLKKQGLIGVQDKINFIILLIMSIFSLFLCFYTTVAYFVNNTKHRLMLGTFLELISNCKIYYSAFHGYWFVSSIFFILQMGIFVILIYLAPAYLMTSEMSLVDGRSGFLTFKFRYPGLYVVLWFYLALMGALLLPIINLNWQTLTLTKLIAQFYFTNSLERKRIPLKYCLQTSFFANFKQMGSIVITSALEILFFIPKTIFSGFIHRYLKRYKPDLIKSIASHINHNYMSHDPLDDNKGASSFLENDKLVIKLRREILRRLRWKYLMHYPLTLPLTLIGLRNMNYLKSLSQSHAILLASPFPLDSIYSTLQTLFTISKIGPVALSTVMALILTQNNLNSLIFAFATFISSFVLTNYAIACAFLPLEAITYTILFCMAEDLRIIAPETTFNHQTDLDCKKSYDLQQDEGKEYKTFEEKLHLNEFSNSKNAESRDFVKGGGGGEDDYNNKTRIYYTPISLLETLTRISPLYGPTGYAVFPRSTYHI